MTLTSPFMTTRSTFKDHTTILLVEDNPDDQELTIRALKKNGIPSRVEIASDGEEAVEYLFGAGDCPEKAGAQKPALILLDLKLPKLNGLEVLHRLKSNNATKMIPVVVLTTSAEQEDLLTSYDYGVNSYIRKPLEFDRFAQVVKDIGLYWLFWNELP